VPFTPHACAPNLPMAVPLLVRCQAKMQRQSLLALRQQPRSLRLCWDTRSKPTLEPPRSRTSRRDASHCATVGMALTRQYKYRTDSASCERIGSR